MNMAMIIRAGSGVYASVQLLVTYNLNLFNAFLFVVRIVNSVTSCASIRYYYSNFYLLGFLSFENLIENLLEFSEVSSVPVQDFYIHMVGCYENYKIYHEVEIVLTYQFHMNVDLVCGFNKLKIFFFLFSF